MYLQRVQIKNFRNLVDFTINFRNGLNVIVGENNAGKTNILDAIRAALGPVSANESVRLQFDDLYRSAAKDALIRVDLTFADLAEDERADFVDLLNYDPNDPKRSTASLHCEWRWDDRSKRFSTRRWGGNRPDSETGIPEDVLQNLPITMLIALRDALAALQPGRQSRIGRLMRTLGASSESEQRALEAIIEGANKDLHQNDLVKKAERSIQQVLTDASGPAMGQEAAIRASTPEFDRIINSLRLVIQQPQTGAPEPALEELWCNGLGYNNLLYIATVFGELHAAKPPALPLLLVEEPEAHLHPQLQTRLTDYLSQEKQPPERSVQTIVTTHSPTIASHVSINAINVLHKNKAGQLRSSQCGTFGLTDLDEINLRRLLDVTKASILFAKGIIVVEGITEALLIPVFAQRLGISLQDLAISVIPLWGVEFRTVAKLFDAERITIPTAFISDSDPPIQNKDVWRQATFTPGGRCARIVTLEETCQNNTVLKLCPSQVTLEYDLAMADESNPTVMAAVWEDCFVGQPSNLSSAVLSEIAEHKDRALHVWRVMCIADADRKGIFAHKLASKLERKSAGSFEEKFSVPQYLKDAIAHASQQSLA